jgi:hypothetical protein
MAFDAETPTEPFNSNGELHIPFQGDPPLEQVRGALRRATGFEVHIRVKFGPSKENTLKKFPAQLIDDLWLDPKFQPDYVPFRHCVYVISIPMSA